MIRLQTGRASGRHSIAAEVALVALLCALMGACGAVRADPEPLLLEHDGRWLVRTPTQLNTLGSWSPIPWRACTARSETADPADDNIVA
jgi:hypothetical protein